MPWNDLCSVPTTEPNKRSLVNRKGKTGPTTVFLGRFDWLAALVTHIPDKGQRKGYS